MIRRLNDLINEGGAYFVGFRGQRLAIVKSELTTISGGIDKALWITLERGDSRIAFAGEIELL